ncbi:MAG: ExeM/NucH family extracellular endonuclease [Marinobacter sp.]|nr:ExeM/NucH family extracellular endonuclease [Marinobacter sp.]
MTSHTARLTALLTTLMLGLPAAAAAKSCGAPATAISHVQGRQAQSPLAGQYISVEGIITLDSRQQGGFRGFYLQQADAETDNDPATSEALFVHTNRPTGQVGHRVRVRGRIKEFHGLTELTNIQLLEDCGRATLPAPTTVRLPWPGNRAPEHLENMRITVAGALTVIDNYNLARYGELTLAREPQTVPTDSLPPGPEAVQLQEHQQLHRLLLDDNHGSRYPEPPPWPTPALAANNTVRAGDTVSQLDGVLDYRFGAWRLQPITRPRFHADNRRPQVPERAPETTLRVVTLNLENYFNGDGNGGGFPTPRGAETPEQFAQQSRRLAATLTAPGPDIVAVAELENDGHGEDSAIATLTRALGPDWRYVMSRETSGSDAIHTGLLYRSDRVEPLGQAYRLSSAPYHRLGRRPLAQIFRPLGRAASVRIIVPHLKSKACHGASGPERDQADGQGCYNHRRTKAARALTQWVDDLPDNPSLAGTLITGDLNSYAQEAPLTIFGDAGYTSMVHRFHPCSPTGCPHATYRYKGRHGSLDYALASAALAPKVTGAWSWPANADEPRALGYQGSVPVPEASPWRSSDHNPVIIDLAL